MKSKISVTLALLTTLTLAALVLVSIAPAPTASGLSQTAERQCPLSPQCESTSLIVTGQTRQCTNPLTGIHYTCEKFLEPDGTECWMCSSD